MFFNNGAGDLDEVFDNAAVIVLQFKQVFFVKLQQFRHSLLSNPRSPIENISLYHFLRAQMNLCEFEEEVEK